MSKKLTIPIAAVAVTTSIATPLVATMTSCSNTTLITPNYDKEYGVNKTSYDNMKKQFATLYNLELKHQGYRDDALDDRMNAFSNTMKNFDSTINSQPIENRYTVATYSLAHFAKTQYGITLERDQYLAKKITWSSIDQMFDGAKSSWNIYLKNSGLSDEQRNEIMNHADKEYEIMCNSLKAKYPNDTLSAYIAAQSNLVKCFDDVNEEIGLFAAQARLQDFMTTYNITYKNEQRQRNGIDKIRTQLDQSIGRPLGADLMNNIFKFTDVTKGETITFKNDIISGHIIQPVLKKINENKYSNEFSLDLDWQIYKDNKDDTPEQTKRKTAHLYLSPSKDKFDKEGALITDDNMSINDLMEDATVVPTGYSIQSTTKYAQQSVLDTYFNPKSQDGYISGIHWSQETSKPNPWETLFANGNNSKEGDVPIQHLTLGQLAASGLELDFVRPDGGGIVTYSFKDLLSSTNDSESSDENLDLAHKFVKYCDLIGDVTIVADENNHHEASATFSVSYNDEYDPQQLDESYAINGEKNFAISEQLYAAANTDFNQAYNSLEAYKNKGIADLKDAATKQCIAAGVTAGVQLIFTGSLIAAVVLNKTVSNKMKVAGLMSGVQLIVAGATLGAVCGISQPVFDFNDRMNDMKRELKDDTRLQEIVDRFENDHNKYFVLWEKDKNPDGAFQAKKKEFVSLPWLPSKEQPTSAKSLKDYYHNFKHSNDWNYLAGKAEKHKVKPEDYKRMADKYESAISAAQWTSVIVGTAIIYIVDMIAMNMIKSDAKPEPEDKIVEEHAEEDKKQEERTAEATTAAKKELSAAYDALTSTHMRLKSLNKTYEKMKSYFATNIRQFNEFKKELGNAINFKATLIERILYLQKYLGVTGPIG